MLKHTQIRFSLVIHNILQIWQFWKVTIINCWSFHQKFPVSSLSLSCHAEVLYSFWIYFLFVCMCPYVHTHGCTCTHVLIHVSCRGHKTNRGVGPFPSYHVNPRGSSWGQRPGSKLPYSTISSALQPLNEFPLTSAKVNFCFLFYKLVPTLPKSL